ncbi:MAG: YXWGXW repeat-containing protein [Alphaproteobacteria bacterium]|nr:YXWGXW repeat-containing protein [Alphaproteobacteria bacterium]
MRIFAAAIIALFASAPALASHPAYHHQARPVVVVDVDVFTPDYRPGHRPGFVWVDGYYDGYGWVPGFWQPVSTRSGYTWVAGYWAGGSYIDGYWRPVSRAGYYWVPGYYSGRSFVAGYWSRGVRPTHVSYVSRYDRHMSYRNVRPAPGQRVVYRPAPARPAPRPAARPAPAPRPTYGRPAQATSRPVHTNDRPATASDNGGRTPPAAGSRTSDSRGGRPARR